jgi:arylsulfatase A-like enzyme
MSKRILLLWVHGVRPAFLAGICVLLPALASGAEPRPNFLFVYTDDQRFDELSCVQQEQGDKGRWPFIQTPNMDRLAREGVRFHNGFVVNSLCAPSRASFLTGCYGYLNGVVNNHTSFPEHNVTYATLLRQAGYTTGFVGKWHMGKQSGQRPGFDFSASFIGQGQYLDCPFEINGKSTPTKGWVDDVSGDFALQFLQENKDKPFVLAVAFKSPHGPCTPPQRLANYYGEAQARTVPNLNIPAIYLNAPDYGKAEPTPAGLIAAKMDYHRCVHGADENLGRILDTLDKLGLTDHTMVIFTSDNGYYLGEHRLGDKRSAYEESMRVPMIVRYPKLAGKGRFIETAALNIDIAPTMLDFAGVPVPEQMQGRSWRPLLEGKSDDWRRSFFYCYYRENGFKTPTMMAVRSDSAKLVKYPGHEEWTELFDLKADPFEMQNLIHDKDRAELRQEMEAAYDKEAQKIGFTVPSFADKEPSRPSSGPRKGKVVLEYHFDQDSQAELAQDRSGFQNDGTVKGAPLVEGRDGRKARRFNGKGHISVSKSDSLSPVSDQWTIEATVKPEKPDGIILAHGGASIGYCLYLKDGKPAFTIHSHASTTTTLTAQTALPQGWTTLTAKITPDHRLLLLVNGQPAATAKLENFISKVPNDALDIGDDLRSPVLPSPQPPPFTGLMESVKISAE